MAAMAGKLLVSFALISYAASSAVEVLQKEVVAVIGGNATIIGRVAYPIIFCGVKFPGESTQRFFRPEDREMMLNKDGVGYEGEGLDRGFCGIYIRNVQSKFNGEFSILVSPPPGESTVDPGKVNLVVAQAPKPPVFYPPIAQKYDVGQTLATQCIIRDGRPRPEIRWFLDDEILMDGLTQPIITGDDLLTITQNLTRKLSINDLGRTLKCTAEHIALHPRDSAVTAQIRIQFAPAPREDPIAIYGIKIGEISQINVTIQASPAPTIEWFVAGERITEGMYGNRLQTGPVTSLGNGYYNATLVMSPVEREDTDREIKLKAMNTEGERLYTVKISTLGEPEGVDLGVGGIVGIVIAVLFLLITVFLIIFARATNRWCFGGGTLRTDIPDTGDSEAPLPGEKGDGNIHVGAVNPSHEDYIPNGNGKSADIKSLPMEKPDTAV